MKDYLKSISHQLKNFSKSLDKKSILIDKPWAMIDEEFAMQKLIFRRNKQLILSKNGKVQEGRWDYFPEARSLLIDRGTDKILCNEAFVDEGVLILKMDGTGNKFFALANENVVPDLDVLRYLQQLKQKHLNIEIKSLSIGKELEIVKDDNYNVVRKGNKVFINSKIVKDGIYSSVDKEEYFRIKNSKIANIYKASAFTSVDGEKYELLQENIFLFQGDVVLKDNKIIKSKTIEYTKYKRLIIKDGKIVKIISINPILSWLGIKKFK